MISEYHTVPHIHVYAHKLQKFIGGDTPNLRPVLGHRAVLFLDSRCFGSHNFQIVPARRSKQEHYFQYRINIKSVTECDLCHYVLTSHHRSTMLLHVTLLFTFCSTAEYLIATSLCGFRWSSSARGSFISSLLSPFSLSGSRN